MLPGSFHDMGACCDIATSLSWLKVLALFVLVLTSPKINMSPLKLFHSKRKWFVFQPINLEGVCLDFQGLKVYLRPFFSLIYPLGSFFQCLKFCWVHGLVWSGNLAPPEEKNSSESCSNFPPPQKKKGVRKKWRHFWFSSHGSAWNQNPCIFFWSEICLHFVHQCRELFAFQQFRV